MPRPKSKTAKPKKRMTEITEKQYEVLKTNDDRMLEGIHGDDIGAILAPVAEDLRRSKKSLSKIPESGIAPPARLDTAPVFLDSIRITRRVQDMVTKEGGALDILDEQMAMDDGDEVTGAMKLKQKLALALVTKTLPTQKIDMNPNTDNTPQSTFSQDVTEILKANGDRIRSTKKSIKTTVGK